MRIETVTGELLDQPVDAIVNAWNRNIIPWWLLQPLCNALQSFPLVEQVVIVHYQPKR
jgi:hypothetical protein